MPDASTIHEDEYRMILQYGAMLFGLPEFDTVGVRYAIQALPEQGWTMTRNGNVMQQIKQLQALMTRQRHNLEARYYELFPGEKTVPAFAKPMLQGERVLVTLPAAKGYGDYEKKVSKRIETILEHLNVQGQMILSADGTHYIRKRPDGTKYPSKYYLQEDGSIYVASQEDGTSDEILEYTNGRVRSVEVLEDFDEESTEKDSDRLHDFNHRFAREMYVQIEDGRVLRFEALKPSGSFPLPDGLGALHYRTVEQPRYFGVVTLATLSWEFEGKKPGIYQLFKKNHLGIPQPGQWVEVKEVQDQQRQKLSGPGYHIYPHYTFGCSIVLADGRSIDIAEDADRPMEEVVAEVNRTLSGVVEVVPERDTDISGRQIWNENGKPFYNWKRKTLGWRFNIADQSAVTTLELGSQHSAKRQREVVDVAESVTVAGKKNTALRLPGSLDKDVKATLSQQAIAYPHVNFTMEVELFDGRVLTCTRSNHAQWNPYIDVRPMDAKRGKAHRENDGWYFTPRNRDAITRITFLYPKTEDATVDTVSPQEEAEPPAALTLSI